MVDPLSLFLQKAGAPAQGITSAGNQTWNGSQWQTQANPSDPNQVANWSSSAIGNGLYNPQTLDQINKMFSPYFNQQKSQMYQTLKNEQGFVGQQAGAQAAASGLANPGQYSSSAQSRLSSAWAPAFSQLQTNQMGQALGATAQQSEFGLQGLNSLYGMALQNQQQNQQSSIWDYVLGGLAGGVGKAAGAALFG